MSLSGQMHIHKELRCMDKSPMRNNSIKYVFIGIICQQIFIQCKLFVGLNYYTNRNKWQIREMVKIMLSLNEEYHPFTD